MLYNYATGRCLDSNAAGSVYTTSASSCGYNDLYQRWNLYGNSSLYSPYMFWDEGTGRCLDSNTAGNVYATVNTACGFNNQYQNWNTTVGPLVTS
ncbi:hypothetical protein [Streptomyces sp. NPDC051572]|uniref:hypothetical protein n=1 Tax=Streptomyces sp. NPDC051572 TaxID=3155802 RepID=UPI00344B943D